MPCIGWASTATVASLHGYYFAHLGDGRKSADHIWWYTSWYFVSLADSIISGRLYNSSPPSVPNAVMIRITVWLDCSVACILHSFCRWKSVSFRVVLLIICHCLKFWCNHPGSNQLIATGTKNDPNGCVFFFPGIEDDPSKFSRSFKNVRHRLEPIGSSSAP